MQALPRAHDATPPTAKGQVTDFKKGEGFLFGKEVIAASPEVHEEVFQIIQRNFFK